jgi:hypothetical protein
VTRGLDRATALDVAPFGGVRSSIDLGLRATPDFLGGSLDLLTRVKRGRFDLAGYATAWGGMSRVGGSWERDFGAQVGLRGYF